MDLGAPSAEAEEDGGDEAEQEMQEAEEDDMVEFPVKDDEDMETDGRRTVAFEEFEDLDAEEEDRQWVSHAV